MIRRPRWLDVFRMIGSLGCCVPECRTAGFYFWSCTRWMECSRCLFCCKMVDVVRHGPYGGMMRQPGLSSCPLSYLVCDPSISISKETISRPEEALLVTFLFLWEHTIDAYTHISGYVDWNGSESFFSSSSNQRETISQHHHERHRRHLPQLRPSSLNRVPHVSQSNWLANGIYRYLGRKQSETGLSIVMHRLSQQCLPIAER